jgi:PAS domain S-box-containing protein
MVQPSFASFPVHPAASDASPPMQDLAAVRHRYLAGDPAPDGVRPVVLAAWQRCRSLGVDPARRRPQPRDAETLDAARGGSRALLESAAPFLDLAHEAVADQPHLFALSDRHGRILRILAGPGLPEEEMGPANLWEGASWAERDIGSNGVGTALATGEPVILMGPEHFQEAYVGWTCIGVPIRAAGEIVGALDFSVPNEHTHVHAWGWTLSIAKGIESALAWSAPSGLADRVATDLETPFHAIRGVLDLLAGHLDLPPTHAGFVAQARDTVGEAEALVHEAVGSLHVSEERLRRISESGMVGLLFWEIGGRITYANDRFLEMIGFSREDLEGGGIDWRAITPGEWEPVDRDAVDQLRAHGATTPFEKEFIRKDGTRVPVLLSAATFSDSTDRGVTLALDMSERKEWERQIRNAYEEARQAVAERDNVLAVVSHDLRNPLDTIGMASALLVEDIPEEKKQTQVAIIRRATDQMARLIQDLLDVARIEGGGMGIEREPCGSTDVVHAAVELLDPLARANSVTLRAEVEGETTVHADRDRLLQVFSNLISNAIQHTPAGGAVEVRVQPADAGETRFAVRDNGSGILPEHLPHLFDRFWQARTSGRAGAGLGLSIAKGIVEAHGGRIWCESDGVHGSTFHFTLPRTSTR